MTGFGSRSSSWGRSARPSWSGRLLFALGNVVLIVLSVSLAFALNEWGDRRAQAALVDQALRGFAVEIEGNRSRIERALAHHQEIVEPIGSGEQTGLQLRTAFLTDTAWESAQASGALALMPYETVAVLAEVHEMQSLYITASTDLVGLLYFGNVFGSAQNPTDVSGYAPALQDLIFFEREMISRYDAALALLPTAVPPANESPATEEAE
ncbi:MAG: hypothetical protein AAFX41_02285 [Bacteroidota bacterium]